MANMLVKAHDLFREAAEYRVLKQAPITIQKGRYDGNTDETTARVVIGTGSDLAELVATVPGNDPAEATQLAELKGVLELAQQLRCNDSSYLKVKGELGAQAMICEEIIAFAAAVQGDSSHVAQPGTAPSDAAHQPQQQLPPRECAASTTAAAPAAAGPSAAADHATGPVPQGLTSLPAFQHGRFNLQLIVEDPESGGDVLLVPQCEVPEPENSSAASRMVINILNEMFVASGEDLGCEALESMEQVNELLNQMEADHNH